MTHKPLQNKDISERFSCATQVDSFGDSSLNHVLVAVAQEVAELLKQTYLIQADSINQTETIALRVIEPEYTQSLGIEPLTKHELEMLTDD